MKKVFKIILIILIVALFGVGVIFGIKLIKDKKSGVQDKEVQTEFSLKWKRMDTKEEISYTPNYNVPSKTETLVQGFTRHEYVNISVPNRQTVNLFGSSVYAVDGSFSIMISDNLGDLDVGESIVNSTSLAPNVVCTKDGDATVHVICKVFDNFTITGYVYSNSDDWSLIRDSIANLEPITTVPINANVTPITLSDIEAVGSNTVLSGSINDTMIPQDVYMGDGVFRSMMYPITFPKAVQSATDFINVMSNGQSVMRYDASNILYIESNGYSIGIIGSGSDEYVHILFGVGEEAKGNVMGLLL